MVASISPPIKIEGDNKEFTNDPVPLKQFLQYLTEHGFCRIKMVGHNLERSPNLNNGAISWNITPNSNKYVLKFDGIAKQKGVGWQNAWAYLSTGPIKKLKHLKCVAKVVYLRKDNQLVPQQHIVFLNEPLVICKDQVIRIV